MTDKKKNPFSLITPPAVLAFPELYRPARRADEGDPVFSCTLIFDPKSFGPNAKKAWKNMADVLNKKAQEAFKMSYADLAKKRYNTGMVDAQSKVSRKTGEIFAGFDVEGGKCIAPWSNYAPEIIDINGNEIAESTQLIYPGAIVRASVSVFDYTNKQSGVNFNLNHVQWLGHGERLVTRESAEDTFLDEKVDEEFLDNLDSALGSGSEDSSDADPFA